MLKFSNHHYLKILIVKIKFNRVLGIILISNALQRKIVQKFKMINILNQIVLQNYQKHSKTKGLVSQNIIKKILEIINVKNYIRRKLLLNELMKII